MPAILGTRVPLVWTCHENLETTELFSKEDIAMKSNKPIIALVGAAILSLGAGAALAYPGAYLAKDAKVTMEQARAQALREAPGSIKSAELEKEHGGSGLRFSFDIQTRKGLREVGIDAVTGKVLENSRESTQAEADEVRSEHEAQQTQTEHEHHGEAASEQGGGED
ncbi:MAG: PepSY domain-containing protein [Betaproteobacteria bacterium]|nr:PepSY domain-containing protein [Betaproteobacteria bacterium]